MSSGEDYGDQFDLYGTPPLRHSGRRRSNRRAPSAQQEASAISVGKTKKRKQAREFKALNTTLQVLGIDRLQLPASSRITASPHIPLQEAVSNRRISRIGSSISLSEASSVGGHPDSPRESAGLSSAYSRFATANGAARRTTSDEDPASTRAHDRTQSSANCRPPQALDFRDTQAFVDDFLNHQVTQVTLSLRDNAWQEAEEWQAQLTACQISMDLELEACHEAVLHFQKALADAKLFHKGLAAKVSSLALDASERYLIMQAMLEHGSRNLVDLGAAAGHCISSQQPSAAGNLEFLLLTDGNRSALKLAASVVRLQRKLASRLRKLVEACTEAHQRSETSQAALQSLGEAGSKLVKAAALAVSKVQARALNSQGKTDEAISQDSARSLCWCWHTCGVMVEWSREHATGHHSPVWIWEAVLNQAVQSATWTIKALHTTKEPDPRAGSSYRNALAARPRPMLQQRAAACTSWLPTIVETLWKEANRVTHASGAGDDTESEAESDNELESQACKAIGFVHALGKSKLLYTGHQSLWQSTEAVINAVLAWRHTLLKAPSQPGNPPALKTSGPQQPHGLPRSPSYQRGTGGRRGSSGVPRSAFAAAQNGNGITRGRGLAQHARSGRAAGRGRGAGGRTPSRRGPAPSPFAAAAAAGSPPSGTLPSLPQIRESGPAPIVPADELGPARPSFRDILATGTLVKGRSPGATSGRPAGVPMPPWEGQPDWAVTREELEGLAIGECLHRMLGSGSCGAIYMVYFQATCMAVKVPLADLDAGSRHEHLLQFSKELRIHKRVNGHSNVVGFLKAWYHVATPERPFTGLLERFSLQGVSMAILMEMCKLGSLHSVIRRAGEAAARHRGLANGIAAPTVPARDSIGSMLYLQWRLRLKLAQGAAAAVAYMHSQHPVLLHSDLKSPNFLVTEDFIAKICDFNLSDVLGADGCITGGDPISPPWSAPERLSGQPFGTAADVFSFGVLLWELITLETPWSKAAHCEAAAAENVSEASSLEAGLELELVPEEPGLSSGGPYWRSDASQLAWLTLNVPGGARLPLPDPDSLQPHLPELPELCNLVERCWLANPAGRPRMVEVRDELQRLYERVKQRPV
ncbi:hypothetical protein WJX84_003458 [Apatococcus fuscideae]|uniref:Protein kinase domain-containing protein n=1 Tax=Apatococcus fuscideae TaxID=2026836 RepID=A0AAW1SSZ5_9CHLO